MMKIAEIWRYPVKTMAGEKLERVRIGPLGLEGDRVVHVEDARGQVITSRSHRRFLGHKGTLGLDGEPLVDGRPWKSPEVAAEVVDIGGPGAKLVRFVLATDPGSMSDFQGWAKMSKLAVLREQRTEKDQTGREVYVHVLERRG